MSSVDVGRPAACVYCLENGHLSSEQVLWRGRHFYLCAPRGQLIEGFLVIAPYACATAITKLPHVVFDELVAMQTRVRQFYAATYKTTAALFYEQGRGGGSERVDPVDQFPLHAHLCCLPAALNLHAVLGRKYQAIPLSAGIPQLPDSVRGRPYIYVDASGESMAYIALRDSQVQEIASARLKPIVADLLGLGERADWRAYPGERELWEVIVNWRRHCEART
jgi:diadenosine tetraphosphate (Ap4A) HIT family hydrolase